MDITYQGLNEPDVTVPTSRLPSSDRILQPSAQEYTPPWYDQREGGGCKYVRTASWCLLQRQSNTLAQLQGFIVDLSHDYIRAQEAAFLWYSDTTTRQRIGRMAVSTGRHVCRAGTVALCEKQRGSAAPKPVVHYSHESWTLLDATYRSTPLGNREHEGSVHRCGGVVDVVAVQTQTGLHTKAVTRTQASWLHSFLR